MKQVYLDYAAATPLDERVLASMQPYFTEKFYNPSALSLASRSVRSDIQAARDAVAREIGATGGEIIFTAGGTEANNIAVHSVLMRHPKYQALVSAAEHDSVIAPANEYHCQAIPVDHKGRISVVDAAKMITDTHVLISCMYANNEVGTIQPISELAELVAKVRIDRKKRGVKTPLYLHTDACQASSHLDLNVARLGVDMMTLNGGKIYGPKQSGMLYVRTGVKLSPFISGGGQEQHIRAGTENVPGIIGFAEALRITRQKAKSEKERLTSIRDSAVSLLEERFPDVIIHGDRKKRLPHNVSFALPDVDNERLLMMLEERGIIAAAGSACHASRGTPSTVLAAMGVDDVVSRSTLRITFGRETSMSDIRSLLDVLQAVYPEAKRLS